MATTSFIPRTCTQTELNRNPSYRVTTQEEQQTPKPTSQGKYNERSLYWQAAWRAKTVRIVPTVRDAHDHIYLYHQTTATSAPFIKANGLKTAEPSFRGDIPDASKDGFLSMATDMTKARAMGGGTKVMLRYDLLATDTAIWVVYDSTEVKAIERILPARLEYSPGNGGGEWHPLSQYP